METKTKKRWDLSKRFLEFSETLFATEIHSIQDLIFLFLQAIDHIAKPDSFHFLISQDRYQIRSNKLVKEMADPSLLKNTNVTKIELLPDTDFNQEHLLLISKSKLSAGKETFLFLVCKQYSLSAQNYYLLNESLSFAINPPPSSTSFWNGADADQISLKARYRQQKSVILMIENYARKKNQPLLFFKDNPELKKEIDQFQNNLIGELERLKKKNIELDRLYHSIRFFFKNLIVEMSNRLAIDLGLIEILSRNQKNKRAFDINLEKIIYNKVLSQKNILDLLHETMQEDRSRPVAIFEEFNSLDLLHAAMALFSESAQAVNIEFEDVPSTGKFMVRANYASLTKTIRNLFDFLCQFHHYCSKETQIRLKLDLMNWDNGVEIMISLINLTLTKEQHDLLVKPLNLYDSVFFEYAPLSLYNYIIHQTATRQGCSLKFSLPDKNGIQCRLKLTNQ
ncbi:MAG: hypothetical protein OEY59_05075 [Deltaproteobacteria bacterium]|nr:hypothetical protein [Deltaproteobacteria bacterium]